jgi:hypothetical protein
MTGERQWDSPSPAVFARQANIANEPREVNNGSTVLACVANSESGQNRVL